MNTCKKLLVLTASVFLLAACNSSQHTKTDRIHIFYSAGGGPLTETFKHISDPWNIRLSIRTDIKGISRISIADDAKEKMICKTERVLSSPMHIATFKLNQDKEINRIEFRIKLPCSAWTNRLYLKIKIDSKEGNFYIRKHLPLQIRTGDGA